MLRANGPWPTVIVRVWRIFERFKGGSRGMFWTDILSVFWVIHRINRMLPQNPAVVSLEYVPIQESSAMDNVPWLWFADHSNFFSKTQRSPGVTPAAFCSVPAKPKRFGSFAWNSGELFGTSSFWFSQTQSRAKPYVFLLKMWGHETMLSCCILCHDLLW